MRRGGSVIVHIFRIPCGNKLGMSELSTTWYCTIRVLVGLQSLFGDKPLKIRVDCPQNGTAVLKGPRKAVFRYEAVKIVWRSWKIALMTWNEKDGLPR